MPGRLSKIAERVAAAAERAHYREGELGPGVPERKISSLPKIREPQVWEFSAHPHHAQRAGKHIDLRLGNPDTGVAHSFVLPKRTALPGPGESAYLVPTFDHTIPYMDYTGRITTEYGKGKVLQGRRTQTEVIHSDPKDAPGTKLRFNLYDGTHPEEYAVRKDDKGNWFLTNKTLTRTRRPDLPAEKPKYREVDVEDVDPETPNQVMMPKLDGAHSIIDLQAGRSPRVFSYRTAKKAPTGLIEHTHKLEELFRNIVPKSLDGTVLRGETVAVNRKGKALPAEVTGGLLNTKVLDSRARQEELGAKLHAFPFDVVKYRGKLMQNASFSEKLKVLKEVEKKIGDLWLPEIATTSVEKAKLIAKIESGKHPLTREGVVLVEPEVPGPPTKAKFAPDFDVFVRKINAAKSGKTGKPHDRAGSFSYSWTEDGPIVGQVGGFAHGMAKDMLKNPDKYVGRVAKVTAAKVFGTEQKGALFQPRFNEWHLEKGDIEKTAFKNAFLDELQKLADLRRKEVGVQVLQDPTDFTSHLEPGDIILTRNERRPLSRLISKVQQWRGQDQSQAMWSHAALYVGDGVVRHAHLPIKGKSLGSGWEKMRVRDHNIKAIHDLGVDMLAVRPDLSEENRRSAVERSKDMLGKSFSVGSLVRAGLLPKFTWKSKELKKENLPESVICTSVIGYSYPRIQLGPAMKSIHHITPGEVAGSASLRPIAALTEPEREEK